MNSTTSCDFFNAVETESRWTAFQLLHSISKTPLIDTLNTSAISTLTGKFITLIETQSVKCIINMLSTNPQRAMNVLSQTIDRYKNQENGGHYAADLILNLTKNDALNPIITSDFISNQLNKFLDSTMPQNAGRFIEGIARKPELRSAISQDQFDAAVTAMHPTSNADMPNSYPHLLFVSNACETLPTLVTSRHITKALEYVRKKDTDPIIQSKGQEIGNFVIQNP